jgi:hypothetical protein
MSNYKVKHERVDNKPDRHFEMRLLKNEKALQVSIGHKKASPQVTAY